MSQHHSVLNSITNIGNINNGVFPVDNISPNSGANASAINSGNAALNWMNHLQILAAAATTASTSISAPSTSLIDNNYLLFTDKTTVVPSIKGKSQLSLCFLPIKLTFLDEKSDSFTVALNKMFETDWTNDEDLLFARLIVVRLKKFDAKNRRMVCF